LSDCGRHTTPIKQNAHKYTSILEQIRLRRIRTNLNLPQTLKFYSTYYFRLECHPIICR
jgi:hypothetical protein